MREYDERLEMTTGDWLEKLFKEETKSKPVEFKILGVRPMQADNHLCVVLAKNAAKQEYITWLFNKECGGLFWGHYFNYWNRPESEAYEAALFDFNERNIVK